MLGKERELIPEEITLENLKPEKFIQEKVVEIRHLVAKGLAINTLSGGVDSATVTLLGYQALGERLKTYFIDNGLMREEEPGNVLTCFRDLGIKVELVNAQEIFFKNLKGISEPEEKREAITRTFYQEVFSKLVKESGARFLLQGTNYTDIEETVAGVKRQHNVLAQLGIEPEEKYGYQIIEPLVQLRKTAIREIAKVLGLPKQIYDRPPFPGPALGARIIGEVTPEKVGIIRAATKIVEEELENSGAFQFLAVLHEDQVTGVKNGKRDFGRQIEVRSWQSQEATTASPTKLSWKILEKMAERLTTEIPGVVSVTYNITNKPPSTIEAV